MLFITADCLYTREGYRPRRCAFRDVFLRETNSYLRKVTERFQEIPGKLRTIRPTSVIGPLSGRKSHLLMKHFSLLMFISKQKINYFPGYYYYYYLRWNDFREPLLESVLGKSKTIISLSQSLFVIYSGCVMQIYNF